ncbi:MAG: YkgJ family cysteine cluster protein [Deltaproteobacteria bacterium]
MTLQEHIRRYIEFVERADRLFDSVAEAHPELMACKPGCDDCCSVYFELSLLEAVYLSGMFQAKLQPGARERVLHRAGKVAPLFEDARTLLARIAQESPEDDEQLHEAASRLKIQCPLNEDRGCMLYEHRPVTCRTYGTPQKIGRRIVSCPRAGFQQGKRYITVDVNKIQQTLSEYSRDFLKDLVGVSLSGPRGPRFSMPAALRTSFDREFFLSLKQGSG